ncbi:MAG: hypothetical protein WA777_12710 [Rhodanobacter sp.]
MQYTNPKMVGAVTPLASGALYLDRQVTNLADPTQFPAAALNGDQIQIGVVPANMFLVPQLSSLQIPAIDTNAAPTAQYTVGIVGAAASIQAAKAGGAAQSAQAGTLLLAGATGSETAPTPIFITLTAAVATLAAAGEIIADLVFRPFRTDVDTDNNPGY